MLSRSLFAEDATKPRCSVRTQPPGERPYFPLHHAGLTSDDVSGYWSRQPFDLSIPSEAGNCVFCFMKGTRQLAQLGAASDPRRRADTPSDISWWAEFEDRHARLTPRRGGEGLSRFGFFGVNSMRFAEITNCSEPRGDRYATGTPACDCTD